MYAAVPKTSWQVAFRGHLLKRRWVWVAAGVMLLAAGAAGGYLAHLPQVNSGWIPVIAALGASLLTTVAVVGVELLRQHDAQEGHRSLQRRDAYSRFLFTSAKFINIATEVHTIRRLATGITPAARIKNGVEFIRQFNRDAEPLFQAWSEVWLVGSTRAIEVANRLITASMPAMSMAAAKGEALPDLIARLFGERWKDQQERDFNDALGKIGLLRKEFAEVARREIGEPAADVFTGIERAQDTAPDKAKS